MTSPITAGWQPIEIRPVFARGQDWTITVGPEPGTAATRIWPSGTSVFANIYPHNTDTTLPIDQWTPLYSWPGVIDADGIYLVLKGPYADTDLVPAGSLMRVRVTMPNTPTPDTYTWLRGQVIRDD